jgi:hypothetical protein
MIADPGGREAGKLADHNRLVVVAVVVRSQAGPAGVAGHTGFAEVDILLAGWPCLWVVAALDCEDVPQDGLVGHPVAAQGREKHKCRKAAVQAGWDSFVSRLLKELEADRRWGASWWSCLLGRSEGTGRCSGRVEEIVCWIGPGLTSDCWKTSF